MAWAAVRDSAPLIAQAADLVDEAGVEHGLHPGGDAGGEHGPRQPHAGHAHREHGLAEALDAGAERRERAPGDLDHLEGADDAAGVAGLDGVGGLGIGAHELGVELGETLVGVGAGAGSRRARARSSGGNVSGSTTACT